MARMIRLVLAVAADKLADVLEYATTNGHGYQLVPNGAFTDGMNGTDDAIDVDPITEVEQAMTRRTARAAGTRTAVEQTRAALATPPTVRRARINPRPGRVVLYTPAGTQKQIAQTLESLRGQNTMRAFVYRAIAKSSDPVTNKIVRGKVANAAEKNGQSIESVDNVIWQLVNKGLVAKQAGDE